MNLQERIAELCKITGDTMYSLSKHAGVSESVLSRIKTGAQVKVSKRNLISLANYFCVNEDWLETGEGERDAPGVVKDTLIHDGALHERFVEVASRYYAEESDEFESSMYKPRIDMYRLADALGVSMERVCDICDKSFPTYTEVIRLLKVTRGVDANWMFLGVGQMENQACHNADVAFAKATEDLEMIINAQKETVVAQKLAIATLQQTINAQAETISALNARIKELENQLK